MGSLHEKHEQLKRNLLDLGRVTVAFSGGVDSTFLLKTAHTVLGDNVLALTARSLSFPKRELDEATAYAAESGIKHRIVDSNELEIEGFPQNPANRCYLCKKELFSKMKAIAIETGYQNLVEGSNTDDIGDYRPGLQAISELGIKSPLRAAGLSKDEIRVLSNQIGLPTWNKPSFACLVSRLPYGERITPENLKMIDLGEQFLLDLGLRQVRVRYHGNLARIELDEQGFQAVMDKSIRESVYNAFKEIGFTYVSLDMIGYRTGSMNETLALSKSE